MTAESFLDAVDARAAAATPGRWVVRHDGYGDDIEVYAVSADRVIVEQIYIEPEDAAFIAAARTDVPRLSAALRAVLALCDLADADGSPGWIPMMPPNGVRATIAEHLGSPA